jgi:hypothetical protein
MLRVGHGQRASVVQICGTSLPLKPANHKDLGLKLRDGERPTLSAR